MTTTREFKIGDRVTITRGMYTGDRAVVVSLGKLGVRVWKLDDATYHYYSAVSLKKDSS